ncbi:MAG: hypothetical protein JSV00_08105 [bacterium]|nr:MAG: hypothetical protein JSV00_08105 [bacterium]
MSEHRRSITLLLWSAVALLPALSLFQPSTAAADSFEILERREMPIQGETVDLDVSADGRWTFVLNSRGEVAVYDTAGALVQIIEVGKGFDSIQFSAAGNRLLLGSSGRQEVRVISLGMRYDIDITQSPFRGSRDAPVTIAVYNDFQ